MRYSTLVIDDFNRRNVNWNTLESDTHVNNLLDLIQDKFLPQHALHLTRFDSALDLVLSSEPQMVGNLCVSERFAPMTTTVLPSISHAILMLPTTKPLFAVFQSRLLSY